MDKENFIIAYTNVCNDITIPEEDFMGVISMLKTKRSIDFSFEVDPDKSQRTNLLRAIYEGMIQFYNIYLGQ